MKFYKAEYNTTTIYRASSGDIVLKYTIYDTVKFIDDIHEYYQEVSPENVPENIRNAFEEKLNDPLTEIEWLKWKAR